MTRWPVPEPEIPAGTDPALAAAARAAVGAFRGARERYTRAELAEEVGMGADGTLTTRLDLLVDTAVAEVVNAHRVNLISEEIGVIDNGSAVTLVVDPVDGTANAVAEVPLSAFSGVVAVDGRATEALTVWLDTGRSWHAKAGVPAPYRTTGRRALDGAAVSLLRPQAKNEAAWLRVSRRAARVRILSSSWLEAALVAQGSTGRLCRRRLGHAPHHGHRRGVRAGPGGGRRDDRRLRPPGRDRPRPQPPLVRRDRGDPGAGAPARGRDQRLFLLIRLSPAARTWMLPPWLATLRRGVPFGAPRRRRHHPEGHSLPVTVKGSVRHGLEWPYQFA